MSQHDSYVSNDLDHLGSDKADQEPSRTIHLFRRKPTVLGLWRRELRFPTGTVMQGDSDLNRVLRQG